MHENLLALNGKQTFGGTGRFGFEDSER